MKEKRPSNQVPRAGADFATWKLAAEAVLASGHGLKAGAIPTSFWTRLFVRGLAPNEAAEQAAVSAYNARPTLDRLRIEKKPDRS